MTLVRYEPRPLLSIWDRMEQMARDMSRVVPWQEEGEPRSLGIPVDVRETDNEVIVRAELPGVKKEDVDLHLRDGVLSIHGCTRSETETEDERYYRREVRSGTFFRSVPLPVGVKEEDLAATYEDGILTVRAPKRPEEIEGRKIEVS